MIPLPHQIIIVDYHGDTIIQNSSAVCQIAVALYNSLHDSILDKHFVKGISVRQQGAMPARKREREREREKNMIITRHIHTIFARHVCTLYLHLYIFTDHTYIFIHIIHMSDHVYISV